MISVHPPSGWRRLLHHFFVFRIIRAHPRLFIGLAAAIISEILLPSPIRLWTRLLIDWNVGVGVYFVTVGSMIARATPQSITRRASITDEGKFFILVLTSLAALAAIAAIIAQLASVKDLTGPLKALHVGLAGLTIVNAWLFIHLSFALHYAHEYFDEMENSEPTRAETHRGGLIFPGTAKPDYFDFLYFSYVIGVACQTADVEICATALRRTALVHGILAFFFNSAVLALTINIAAGLI